MEFTDMPVNAVCLTCAATVSRLQRSSIASLAAIALAILPGCAASGLSTAVGPSRGAVIKTGTNLQIPGVKVVPLTNAVAARLSKSSPVAGIGDIIGDASPVGTIVGVGDSLEITIWEAPPAVLFGSGSINTRIESRTETSRPGTFPETVVGPSGAITIPFAGQIPAAGRSLRQIEQTIVARLRGKANQPQVIARIARNATANVAVVGEVGNAGRFPLTPRGERLLDVIALAGGTRQPLERMTVQVTRGATSATMPMQSVVRDARNNIILARDDIVTAIYQPNSFVVLGAAGKNEEVRFEGSGITLSQALGRLGGLQDMRADPKGVFLFRWESADRARDLLNAEVVPTEGPVPIIFQVNLKEPETFFASQNFAMKNGDVIFISNSPASDLQRFVNLVASTVLPALSVTSTVRAQ